MQTTIKVNEADEDGVQFSDEKSEINPNWGLYRQIITPEMIAELLKGRLMSFGVNGDEYTVMLEFQNEQKNAK